MSMKRASPTAIYAVSAEFTRQLHCLTLIQSCKTYPTKDDPLWSRQAVDSFITLRVRSFARYLYAQKVQFLISAE